MLARFSRRMAGKFRKATFIDGKLALRRTVLKKTLWVHSRLRGRLHESRRFKATRLLRHAFYSHDLSPRSFSSSARASLLFRCTHKYRRNQTSCCIACTRRRISRSSTSVRRAGWMMARSTLLSNLPRRSRTRRTLFGMRPPPENAKFSSRPPSSFLPAKRLPSPSKTTLGPRTNPACCFIPIPLRSGDCTLAAITGCWICSLVRCANSAATLPHLP